MTDPARVFQERWQRIQKAIRLEKTDRTPVVLEYSGFASYATETPMAEFLGSPTKTLDTMVRTFQLVGDADAMNYGSFWPYGLCYDFMAKVRVPGVDLPDDVMWQVVETELMTRHDYDLILDRDWPNFLRDFMKDRIFDDVPPERLPPNGSFPTLEKNGPD